jgi:fatty acid desaturase
MDHKSFLRALPAEVKAELTTREDGPTVRRLALHFGLIVVCAVWIVQGWPLWGAVIPVQGVLIAYLFMIEHEATHKTLLSNEAANDWIGRVAGVLILLPFQWFRWFHLAHHRHTNDPANDPELAGGPKPETRAGWAWHVSGLPYWIAEAGVIWRLAFGQADDGFIPANAKPRVVREARVMLMAYGLALLSLFATPVLFWTWLLPVAIGQVALRIFLFSEHADCPHSDDMLENTRTTFTTRLMRLFTLNASYHIEHHSYPQVPWYKLPDLHRLMAGELRTTSDGYAAFTKAYLAKRG